MQKHKNAVHKQSPWTCKSCCKYFASKCHLEIHMKRVHENAIEYKCNTCEMVFKYKEAFVRHSKKTKHCVKCKKSFVRKDSSIKICKLCA